MDAFSYTDIFDTKGIEYLVVIGFLLVLIPVWIWLNKPVGAGVKLIRSIRGLSEAMLQIPPGLHYHKNHTWAYLEKSGSARIGLDDLLLHMTGGVSVDFLEKEGEKVKRGELVAMLKKEDRNLKISSPVSGEIRKLNQSVKQNEGLINQDPYGKGWLYLVKPEHWKEESMNGRLEEEAVKWTREELSRCKDFLTNALTGSGAAETQTVLQAGGELTDFPLAEMSQEIWNKFQQEFLD